MHMWYKAHHSASTTYTIALLYLLRSRCHFNFSLYTTLHAATFSYAANYGGSQSHVICTVGLFIFVQLCHPIYPHALKLNPDFKPNMDNFL